MFVKHYVERKKKELNERGERWRIIDSFFGDHEGRERMYEAFKARLIEEGFVYKPQGGS